MSGYCPTHGAVELTAAGCPQCIQARQMPHACPLVPVSDDEATRALLEVSRTAQNTQQIVTRLGERGLAIGRRPR